MMPGASVSLALGAGILATVVAIAVYTDDTLRWRRSLHTFRLHLPRDLTLDDATRWLATIAATTHPPRWSLFPLPPIVIEVLATRSGIAHYVLSDAATRDILLASVRANLPGARLDEEPAYLHRAVRRTIAAEFTLTSRSYPLAVERAEPVSASLLAALQPLGRGERIILQCILTSAGTPAPVVSRRALGTERLPVWWAGQVPADADALRARRSKQHDPLLMATFRIGVTAASRRRASELLARAARMLPGLNASGVRLVRRLMPSLVAAHRLAVHSCPLIAWPLLLNVREAVGLLALPFHAHLPGVPIGQARQLPPPPTLPTVGTVIGRSNYPGLSQRALALGTGDRLQHLHLIGPTGTGKSTLLAQLALQDIAHGQGVVVLDPKGDLVSDIAARVPAWRTADVVVLDPSAVEPAVVGFNPLRAAPAGGDAASRELIAEQVLGIFHAIYMEFWGPRTDEILRAALFSLSYTAAPDGAAFTLIEVPELLTSPALRRYVCAHPALPPHLRSFWQWFDGSLRPKDRVEATGPVLNKLRAFSMRSNIRLLLGQSEGVRLDEHVQRGGVVLISLAKGTIGAEAASLLGALFVAMLWQVAQARIALPPEQRCPLFAYLDEFQDVVRLGADTSLADMLAQARGLGVSLTLAHQYLSQLPEPVRDAALGTVRTHVAFQLEWEDARVLAARFAPLSREDLAGLSPFEFAMKPCVAGQTLAPVTGMTLPLGAPVRDGTVLAEASRAQYGMTRPEVEGGLHARLSVASTPRAGRRYGRETTSGTGDRA